MRQITGYHSTNNTEFQPENFLHIGTYEQAKMRGGKYLYKISLKPVFRVKIAKDKGSWDIKALRRYALRADIVEYLNRYEGLQIDDFQDLLKTHDLDAMSDKEFKRHVPAAQTSWIILKKELVAHWEKVDWENDTPEQKRIRK